MWSSKLDSSVTSEGGFLDTSQKTGQEDVRLRRVQTVVPVMIKHLVSAPSCDNVKLWDFPARMFVVFGIIRNVEVTATKISYDIEDQTGTITALKWLEADKKASDYPMQINTYIRIIGFLREQNNKRHILILRMWSLQRLNQLTNHILEVTYATLKAEAITKKVKGLGTERRDNAINEVPDENSPYYGMTADQTLVYKIIHAQNDSESGINRSDIKTSVPTKILSQVDNILDFLVSEGHIYTTSTDNHFKTT